MTDIPLDRIIGLGIALAAGLLIGFERGWHQREMGEGQRVAGWRTFALVGLLGGLAGLLAQSYGSAVVVVLVAAATVLMLAGYLMMASQHRVLGLTTVMAALATFLVGVLATSDDALLASLVAVVVVALLRFKRPMHAGIERIGEVEIGSGIQLLLISVVVLPVLPDSGFGPYAALNPYKLWWAVVLLALLSFVGFVLMRWTGAERGVTITGLLGGLVSSTATTATLARWTRDTPALAGIAAGAATLATAAMFLRMTALVLVVAPMLGRAAIAALAAMGLAGAVIGFWLTRRASGGELPDLPIKNPLNIKAALQFAALLALVMLLARFLADRFGDAGLVVTAAVSGLVDVDAITLSVGRMVSDEVVPTTTAALAVFIAAGVNQITKLGLLWVLGNRSLAWRVLPAFAAMAAAGAAVGWAFA